MSNTVRLTMAQALVRHLAALRIELHDGSLVPYCAGVWAIFGHGNVAGLGEALAAQRESLPTYRARSLCARLMCTSLLFVQSSLSALVRWGLPPR